MVTQQQVETFLTDIRTQHSAAASVFSDVDDVEVRVYQTGQVEVILRNETEPGMADGTAGSDQAPADPTTADENANADLANGLEKELRSLGATVDQTSRGGSIEVIATFQ